MNILVIFFIRVMAVKKPFFFHSEIMTLCFWQVMQKGMIYQVGLIMVIELSGVQFGLKSYA